MDLSSLILPTEFHNHFTRIEVLQLCDISTKEHILELHLEEKNNLPSGYPSSEYESKGFYPLIENWKLVTVFGFPGLAKRNRNYKVICYYLSFEWIMKFPKYFQSLWMYKRLVFSAFFDWLKYRVKGLVRPKSFEEREDHLAALKLCADGDWISKVAA